MTVFGVVEITKNTKKLKLIIEFGVLFICTIHNKPYNWNILHYIYLPKGYQAKSDLAPAQRSAPVLLSRPLDQTGKQTSRFTALSSGQIKGFRPVWITSIH